MLAALPSRLVQKKGVQSLFYAVCRNLQDQRVVDRCRRAAHLTRSLIPRMEQNATADTLQATAEYFFESHQYELAADRLRSLLASALNPEQRRVITARYVLAASHLSAEESARCAAELPEVPVIQDMNMNELEEMLKRRDFLKRSAASDAQTSQTAQSAAQAAQAVQAADALSHPSTPVAEMEVEEASGMLENVRKLVGGGGGGEA